MRKKHRMMETLGEERVFTIKEHKNNTGQKYGNCYFPKELIGLRFVVRQLTKEEIKKIKKKRIKYKKEEMYF